MIIHEIDLLLNDLNQESDQSKIEHIIRSIPTKDLVLKRTIFNRIKKKTQLNLKDLEEIFNDVNKPNNPTKEEIKKFSILQFINKLQKENKNNEYLKYDNKIIELTNSEINLLIPNKKKSNKFYREIIGVFKLALLSKTKDYKKDNVVRYTFKANRDSFYNYSVSNFLKIYDDKIFKRTLGQDVIKYIFYKKGRDIAEKKAKYVLGFKNGWCLPIDDNSDYSIIWDTDEQRQVLKRSKKIYRKYTQEEKDKINEKLKDLVERTQMSDEYLTILISFCIIAPFKIYFIKKFGLFPHLILSGKMTAGKTSVANFFSTNFYGHYKEHCASQTAKSLARFEDIITASSLPRLIDDFNEVPKYIVNILKEMATSISDYKRKLSAITQISRPKVTPLIMTSNNLGDDFKDPANSSRAIVLEFEQPIKRDSQWIKLKEELRKEKLFSLLYDLTKNWKNNDVDDLMDEVDKTINIDEIIKNIEKNNNAIKNIDINYPRSREIYQIIVAGAILFKKISGIKLPLKNVFETLLSSRRNVSEELLSQFIAFCNMKLEFYSQEYPPRFLSCGLNYNDTDGYNFKQTDLRDFNEFTRKNYKLKPLAEMLQEGLTDKSKIEYTTRRINRIPTKVIVIKLGLLNDALSFNTELDEKYNDPW